MSQDKIQTALWLSRSTFKKLKLCAIKDGKTQSEVVEELINKYFDDLQKQSVSVEKLTEEGIEEKNLNKLIKDLIFAIFKLMVLLPQQMQEEIIENIKEGYLYLRRQKEKSIPYESKSKNFKGVKNSGAGI
jgi:predicted DNA-binding protein